MLEYTFDEETEQAIKEIDIILASYQKLYFHQFDYLGAEDIAKMWLNDDYRNRLVDIKMQLVNLATKVVIRLPKGTNNHENMTLGVEGLKQTTTGKNIL